MCEKIKTIIVGGILLALSVFPLLAMARWPQRQVLSPAYQGYLINDGDSLSTTIGSSDGGTILTYVNVPGKTLAYATVAISGQTLAGNISTFPNTVGAVYNSMRTIYGTSIPFVVQILSGANDIRLGGTASAIYANLQAYINLVHALGPNAKVMATTYLVQCDIFGNGPQLAVLQTLNNSVISNWNVVQSSGGLNADGLVNYWADLTIGPNSYVSSTFCGFPNIYSPDGQHATNVSKAIMGSLEQTSIIGIFQ